MTIKDFRENPATVEFLPKLARVIDEMLVEQLMDACTGSKGGDLAQAEIGAAKCLAETIRIFRTAATPAVKVKPITLKKLYRNMPNKEQPKTETP